MAWVLWVGGVWWRSCGMGWIDASADLALASLFVCMYVLFFSRPESQEGTISAISDSCDEYSTLYLSASSILWYCQYSSPVSDKKTDIL